MDCDDAVLFGLQVDPRISRRRKREQRRIPPSQKEGQPHVSGYELQIWDNQPAGFNTGSLVGSVKKHRRRRSSRTTGISTRSRLTATTLW